MLNNVKDFGARGNGLEDDRAAIQSALDTTAWLGGDVYFPPGKYIVGRSATNSWCLDMPGDNLTLRGVKGASWIKAATGMPSASVAVLVSFFCDDIWVLDNEIYDRTTDASAGRHAGSITVKFDGSGDTTMQPSGVTVRGNRIHARHGVHGIQIVGTGARARTQRPVARRVGRRDHGHGVDPLHVAEVRRPPGAVRQLGGRLDHAGQGARFRRVAR